MSELVLKFEEITKENVASAGGKGANLGEMTEAGIPVPAGFVITAAAYDLYMERNGLEPETYSDNEKLHKLGSSAINHVKIICYTKNY